MRSEGRPWLATGLLLAALALLLVPALWLVVHAGHVVANFPWQLDREEGFLLHQALTLRAGGTIYPALDSPPYVVGNYPPLYPLLWSGLVDPTDPSLASGRILVLLAALVTAAVAAFLCWRITCSWIAALLGPALFLATWEWCDWTSFTRVDVPAVALSILAFALLAGRWTRARLALGALGVVLAFFTKQTSLAVPAAVFFTLLLQGRRREAALLLGLTAIPALLITGVLAAATDGAYWRHTVTFNSNVFEWNQLVSYGRHLVRLYLFQLLATALAVIWLLRAARGSARITALLLWFGLSLLSCVQLAKVGSATNYLLEWHVASALVIAVAAMRSLRETPTTWAPALGLLLLLAGAQAWFPLNRLAMHPLRGNDSGEATALLVVMAQPGAVIADEPITLLRAGKPVLYQPFIMAQLAREGKWDPAPFIASLRGGEFDALLTTVDLETPGESVGWTADMKSAAMETYRFVDVIPRQRGTLFTYAPRPAPATPVQTQNP